MEADRLTGQLDQSFPHPPGGPLPVTQIATEACESIFQTHNEERGQCEKAILLLLWSHGMLSVSAHFYVAISYLISR